MQPSPCSSHPNNGIFDYIVNFDAILYHLYPELYYGKYLSILSCREQWRNSIAVREICLAGGGGGAMTHETCGPAWWPSFLDLF